MPSAKLRVAEGLPATLSALLWMNGVWGTEKDASPLLQQGNRGPAQCVLPVLTQTDESSVGGEPGASGGHLVRR